MPQLASEYVAARMVLLDALEALGSQRGAIIVVGAQAVYLRTGDVGITGVAPYTTDADLTLAHAWLAAEPRLNWPDSRTAGETHSRGGHRWARDDGYEKRQTDLTP